MYFSNYKPQLLFDTGSELIWISKNSFHTIIEAHVDELDFHSNVLHRQIRDATRKKQSLVGQSKVIKQLIKSTSKLQRKFNREMINGHVESLHNIMNARFYEHDDFIYYEDDVVNERSCMYIIISGGVNIIKTYIELNKQHVEEEKEVLLQPLQESESFGMHEILLECSRQTSARAVGKTIVLTLDYKQIHQHWIQYDKESKAMYKMSLLLNDKQKYNVYSELSTYSKFMVLFTSHYSRVARRTDVHPTYHGLTVLVDGECEVYQNHHSGGSSDEKTNRTQHKKKHTHQSVAVSPVRKRGSGASIADEGGSGRSSAVGRGNHFTVGTIKRIKPKSKFLNDNDTTNAIGSSLNNSNNILGIVGNGFTFDSTTTENHSFKSRTEISLVRIPPSTFAAYIKHGTDGKIVSNRNILLEHLSKNAAVHHGIGGSGGDANGTHLSNVQNNNRIQQEQQRQQRQQKQLLLLQQPPQQLPFLLQNAMTFVDHSKSSIKSLNLNKSSMMSEASMTGTTTAPGNDVSVPSTRFIPHPPPSRINYSRAAIQSDRVHSNVLKDDPHSNQLPPPSSPSLPPVTPRNNGGAVPLRTEQELEYEREMRAGLIEERKIVNQYSPRLNNSIAHRKSRRHKFKPLVSKKRRYRLSKLFNRRGYASKGGHGGYYMYGGRGHGGRKNGYTRIHRDYKEEQKKKGLHGDFSLNQANVVTATGSIELFDSNNYCGPTTGYFF